MPIIEGERVTDCASGTDKKTVASSGNRMKNIVNCFPFKENPLISSIESSVNIVFVIRLNLIMGWAWWLPNC